MSPPPIPSPIIYNSNTMNTESLVQIRQSNKCCRAPNDETYTWDLVQAFESGSPASCNTPAIFIDSIRPNNQPEKSKDSRNEIRLPTNHVVLTWST